MNRSDRIRERRKALGYTAEELGDMIGRTRATIYKYENGALKKMDIEVLKLMAKALRTSVEYLTGETDDPSPSVFDRPLSGDGLVLTPDEEDLIYRLRFLTDKQREMVRYIVDRAYHENIGDDDAGIQGQ